jgi:hypothetical protein
MVFHEEDIIKGDQDIFDFFIVNSYGEPFDFSEYLERRTFVSFQIGFKNNNNTPIDILLSIFYLNNDLLISYNHSNQNFVNRSSGIFSEIRIQPFTEMYLDIKIELDRSIDERVFISASNDNLNAIIEKNINRF